MAPVAHVLILGGTSEASELARRLAARAEPTEVTVTTSFAGRTRSPVPPPGELRVGGFGGVDGFTEHLREHGIGAVVDATHPFAAQMPHHAAEGCRRAGVPRLRLLRPAWEPVDGDRWSMVAGLDAAALEVGRLAARRVFLTTGRQELRPFAALRDTWFLVRSIEPPEPMPLPCATVILDRGPFDAASEQALLETHDIDAVVTKNSGGRATEAKLTAARAVGLPVVVVQRPPTPEGPRVETVEEAAAWVVRVLHAG